MQEESNLESNNSKESSKWGSIIAIMSLIIAVFTFFLTIYQFNKTQDHSILTVQPFLMYETKNDTIELRNEGLGPAIIQQTLLRIDNDPYILVDTKKQLDNLLIKNKILAGFESKYIRSGTPFPTGEEGFFLLSYKKSKLNLKKIKESISRLQFKIIYKDFYGNNKSINGFKYIAIQWCGIEKEF